MTDEVEDYVASLAAKLLEQETSDEVHAVKLRILERIAAESDIKPSRIPAPLNITEIGGYFNLLMKLKKEAKQEQELKQQKAFSQMLSQTLTSILGLPMQAPME